MRKTKIVCTLGPATSSKKTITQLIEAGMNVARLNFSHGSHDDHARLAKIIRETAGELNKPVAVLQDLQGPKLRVGKMKNGSIQLKTGAKIKISIRDIIGDETTISTTYEQLSQDVKPGDSILLNDGLIRLKVDETSKEHVNCTIEEGGILSDHKGINLPNVTVSQPSFTDKDRDDLLFGFQLNVDFVAMSFVRSANDIVEVKKIIADHKRDCLVIAKLEKPEAIADLTAIIEASDGVMIARGDLGVEMPLQKVPVLQKKIIQLCLKKGKPVITATQMLESMRKASRPTRAEVSDVANAIFDGSDAVMLSAETATGDYPIETVVTMAKIILEAEISNGICSAAPLSSEERTQSIADAVSFSACEAAEHLRVRAIVAFTNSGFTARMVSKYRPATKIIVFTSSDIVQRQLNLSWGVNPLKMRYYETTDEIIQHTEKILLEEKIVQKGDVIIVLLGAPIFVRGTTNLMKIHVVGE
ncbi:MAG TPA: pyruvate kinase [bacterium]|nr:pyruvate kinase [bacterium]